MDHAPFTTLSNGVRIPSLGLGLSTHHEDDGKHRAYTAVGAALKTGVRLFDTAKRYGNEAFVGEALTEGSRESIPADNLFVTTKLWPGDTLDQKTIFKAAAESAERLQRDVLDLYLVHWPGPWGPDPQGRSNKQLRADTWRAMELLLEKGDCRAIGVSNFLVPHLEELLEECSVVPHVNQIEFNPFQHPAALHEFCKDNKIQMEGYSPLGKGRAVHSKRVQEIAASHNKSPAQVLIRWSLDKGVICIPKSTNPQRVVENFNGVLDFQLSESEVEEMSGWHQNLRVTWDPSDVE